MHSRNNLKIHTTMKLVRFSLMLLIVLSSCTVRREGREIVDLTQDWKFLLGDSVNASETNFVDSTWRTLT